MKARRPLAIWALARVALAPPLLLVVPTLLSACKPAPTAAPTANSATPSVSTLPTPAPAVSAATPAAALGLDTIGMAARPPLPSKAANTHLREGLAKHKKGDYAASLSEFEAAVALAPNDSLAHFDLACAASRGGDFERARREVDALLALDLPAYAARLESDADLADLRRSPEGALLRARVDALRPAYERAVTQGVSAVMFRARPPAISLQLLDPIWLRAGVWVHATRRFVPLSPDVPATAAWFDRARGRTVVVHVSIGDCGTDFCPSLGTTTLSVFAALASTPTDKVERGVRDVADVHGVTAHAGASIWLELSRYSGEREVARLEGGKLVPSKPPTTEGRTTLTISPYGTIETITAEGYGVERGALVTPAGARVKLDKAHLTGQHAVVVHGDRAAVVTSKAQCGCDGEGDAFNHAVAIVDLSGGHASSFETGPGVAALALDDSGAVYLQVDERVRRWDSIDSMTAGPGEALADGVLLTVPRHENGNCCGL